MADAPPIPQFPLPSPRPFKREEAPHIGPDISDVTRSPLVQGFRDLLSYGDAHDEYLNEAAKSIIEKQSKGKVTRKQYDDFKQNFELKQALKKIVGGLPAEVILRTSVSHPGAGAERFLEPGAVSPVDIEREAARKRYVRAGLILSDERAAELTAAIAAALAGAARRFKRHTDATDLLAAALAVSGVYDPLLIDAILAALPPDP